MSVRQHKLDWTAPGATAPASSIGEFRQNKLCGVCEQECVAIDAELRSYLRQAFAKLELADGHTSVLSVAPFCLAY